MTLAALVACLLAGVGLGWRFAGLRRVAAAGQKAGVYLLVFFMGMSLGLDDSLVSRLGTLGARAAVMAACVTLGSAACTMLLTRVRR